MSCSTLALASDGGVSRGLGVGQRQQARAANAAKQAMTAEERAAKKQIIGCMKLYPCVVLRLLGSAHMLIERFGGEVPDFANEKEMAQAKKEDTRKVDRRRRRIDAFVVKDLKRIVSHLEPAVLSTGNLDRFIIVRGQRDATSRLLCEIIEAMTGYSPDQSIGFFETLDCLLTHLMGVYNVRQRPARLWTFPIDWKVHGPWQCVVESNLSLHVKCRWTDEAWTFWGSFDDNFELEFPWSLERACFHHPESKETVLLCTHCRKKMPTIVEETPAEVAADDAGEGMAPDMASAGAFATERLHGTAVLMRVVASMCPSAACASSMLASTWARYLSLRLIVGSVSLIFADC